MLLALDLIVHDLYSFEVLRDLLQGSLIVDHIHDEVGDLGPLKVSVSILVDLGEEFAALFVREISLSRDFVTIRIDLNPVLDHKRRNHVVKESGGLLVVEASFSLRVVFGPDALDIIKYLSLLVLRALLDYLIKNPILSRGVAFLMAHTPPDLFERLRFTLLFLYA